MNVLSIDLDFIAEPYIQLYHKINNERSVDIQWNEVFNDPALIGSNFDINPSNVVYALDIFSRALAKCKNVVFGITHDTILFELQDENNLNIVNIDHHHDIMYDSYHDDRDLQFDIVREGTWVEYLHRQGRLQKYVWIKNKNSMVNSSSSLTFSSYLKNEYQFEMIPDLIYVCLSPTYIPKFHWFYFKIFINLYKALYEGEVKFYPRPHIKSTLSNPMKGHEDFFQDIPR